MNKKPQAPAVITGAVAKAPTSAVAAPPPTEVLDKLTRELDSIAEIDGRAHAAFKSLDEMRVPTRKAIEAAKAAQGELEKLVVRAERAENLLWDLTPDEDRYAGDEGFRNGFIASRLALTLAMYPDKNSVSNVAFGAVLLEDVKAAHPSIHALETTGPAIRRTMKFKPSIAEYLGELKVQEDKWRKRLSVYIEGTQELLEAAIPGAEERLAREEERKTRVEEQRRLAAEQEAARQERLQVIFERVEREAREREEARRVEDQRRRAEEWEWLTEEERQRRRDEEGMFG